jgi:hypothetical protein
MKELISSELTIRGCTNTLQVGQQFGNFKSLADYFAITYKGSATNVVKSIEKELQQYFTWQKIGPRSLQITEIFSEKKEVPPKILSSSYTGYALPIIGELLFYQTSSDPNKPIEIILSNKELCMAIGTCNSKLFDPQFTQIGWKQEVSEEARSEIVLQRVLASNHEKNYEILRQVREKLVDSKLVLWESVYIYSKDGKTAVANKEYAVKFTKACAYALEQLHCKGLSEVFLKGLFIKYKKLSQSYAQEHFGVDTFQDVNRIISSPALIDSYLRRLLWKEHAKIKMSQKVLTAHITRTTKKYHEWKELYENTKEELEDGDIPIYSESKAIQELRTAVCMHTLFRY